MHDFQTRLLNKELINARNHLQSVNEKLEEKRRKVQDSVPSKCLASVAVYTRKSRLDLRQTQMRTHNRKLLKLSAEQEHPLFNVENTVVLHWLDATPPSYVMETISLGPKNAVLDRFEQKDILAEMDGFLGHCKLEKVNDEVITDINVKTLNYIKKVKKMKPSRNIMLTKK